MKKCVFFDRDGIVNRSPGPGYVESLEQFELIPEFVDVLRLFQADPDTRAVVLIGEIGGTMEQDAAQFIKDQMTKPVVGVVVGATAPPGRRMGHAGAIITGTAARASEKKKTLAAAGVTVAPNPAEIGDTAKRMLEEKGIS